MPKRIARGLLISLTRSGKWEQPHFLHCSEGKRQTSKLQKSWMDPRGGQVTKDAFAATQSKAKFWQTQLAFFRLYWRNTKWSSSCASLGILKNTSLGWCTGLTSIASGKNGGGASSLVPVFMLWVLWVAINNSTSLGKLRRTKGCNFISIVINPREGSVRSALPFTLGWHQVILVKITPKIKAFWIKLDYSISRKTIRNVSM